MNMPETFAEREKEPGWVWRNCRSLGFHFSFWLWPWFMGSYRTEDTYGGERWLYFGPFAFGIAYSIGNRSSDGLDRFTALSEVEAYERAARSALPSESKKP